MEPLLNSGAEAAVMARGDRAGLGAEGALAKIRELERLIGKQVVCIWRSRMPTRLGPGRREIHPRPSSCTRLRPRMRGWPNSRSGHSAGASEPAVCGPEGTLEPGLGPVLRSISASLLARVPARAALSEEAGVN